MIYLDNAATTKPDSAAVERAMVYLNEKFYNPSAVYHSGHALSLELKEARRNILSNIADVNTFELVFTSCGSEADNQAVFSCGRRGNVVTSEGEHSAILSAVAELKNRGIEVRFAPLCSDGSVNVEALLSLVDEKTSLVTVMHVNNETGAINDINAIAKRIKAKYPRVLFHSDGVQAFGKLRYRLSKDVDLYSISAHKIGGLKGTGALIKRKSLVLHPYIYGGGQESGLRSGTENVFGIKTLEYAAAAKYQKLSETYERMAQYNRTVRQGLNGEIFSCISGENASPYILSVAAKGMRGETLLHMLDDAGVMVGTGSACSSNEKKRYSHVILACGYDKTVADGILRISFSADTTEEEVNRAIAVINRVGSELKEKMA